MMASPYTATVISLSLQTAVYCANDLPRSVTWDILHEISPEFQSYDFGTNETPKMTKYMRRQTVAMIQHMGVASTGRPVPTLVIAPRGGYDFK